MNSLVSTTATPNRHLGRRTGRDGWKITTLILALALAISLGAPLITSASAHEIRQPHVEAALTATNTALRQLQKAAPNKDGHRVKAISHLEAARDEIKAAIEAGGQHEH